MSRGKGKRIGMTEAIRRVGISAERLRYWELKGIITPDYDKRGAKKVRRYSDEDIAITSEIRKMVDDDGFSLRGAAERLNRPYRAE
jgi:DNA-binding transcriptional MerR regulator